MYTVSGGGGVEVLLLTSPVAVRSTSRWPRLDIVGVVALSLGEAPVFLWRHKDESTIFRGGHLAAPVLLIYKSHKDLIRHQPGAGSEA